MNLQPIESPVRPTHRTSGVTRPLAVTLALAAALVGILSIPSTSHAQSSCYCPDGTNSQGNPVTSTTCGEQVCGADFQYYSCQESGWVSEGGTCGDPEGCSCTGTDYAGNTVIVNTCGQQVCGADFQYYSCGETGWTAQGGSCPGGSLPPSSCYCPNGVDYLGNPITATTCGEQVCGADFQYYSCGETGWSAQGTACPEEGPVAGTLLPTLTPLDIASVVATTGLDPATWEMDLDALQSVIAVSNVEVRFGRALYALTTLPPTASLSQRNEILTAMSLAQVEMDDLLRVQALLPVAQVERARFPVLIARLIQLETQYANTPGYAVQLARQVYYNGAMYSAASGALEISQGLLHLTGLPHGRVHPDGNGGYIANIRAPDGEQVDLGHVMCAVDFNAPYPRVGSIEPVLRNIQYYGNSPLPNPANHGGMVTLAGDLGTAANYYLQHDSQDAWGALMHEGHSDMRGDVDGLNLSALLANHGWSGATPLASELTNYYFNTGPLTHTDRVELFLATSPYVFLSEDLGQFVIAPSLYIDVNNVAMVFSLFGNTGISGIDGTHPVVEAFAYWLYLERYELNPPTDE